MSSTFKNKINAKSRQASGPSAHPFRQNSNCLQAVPFAWFSRACGEKCSLLPGRGAHPATGGGKIPGNRMNGTLRFAFTLLQRIAAFTVSITTSCATAGSCGEFTTDVHRAPRAVRIQLSRRLFPSRRIDRRLCGTQRARHGLARPRWRVWLAPLSPGGEKTLHSGPHRRGSHFHRGLALSLARGIARRLPEPVPAHHANEAPRAKGRRQRSP